jgi:ribosomal protein L33
MLRTTLALLVRGQYKTRLKKRMVGFIPKVIPRKVKGNLIALRSEANTGYMEGYLKSEAERQDNTGRKVQKVLYDPWLQRHTLFKEAKIKGPFLTKAHIAKRMDPPSKLK